MCMLSKLRFQTIVDMFKIFNLMLFHFYSDRMAYMMGTIFNGVYLAGPSYFVLSFHHSISKEQPLILCAVLPPLNIYGTVPYTLCCPSTTQYLRNSPLYVVLSFHHSISKEQPLILCSVLQPLNISGTVPYTLCCPSTTQYLWNSPSYFVLSFNHLISKEQPLIICAVLPPLNI